MDLLRDDVEARIVGVLIEKQMATPDYYPLTLNALVNGCNQKTNREPVMLLTAQEVEEALGRLRHRRWVWQVKAQGSRTLKYEHNIKQIADFSDHELGIICVLLLRGPQTAGELRSRTARLAEFHGLAAVEHTLHKLSAHEQGPFVLRLDRRPGHKEHRYGHLFRDTPSLSDPESAPEEPEPAVDPDEGDGNRIRELQRQIEDLQSTVEDLKSQFHAFKRQFD